MQQSRILYQSVAPVRTGSRRVKRPDFMPATASLAGGLLRAAWQDVKSLMRGLRDICLDIIDEMVDSFSLLANRVAQLRG